MLMGRLEISSHLTVTAQAKLRLILGETQRPHQSVRLVTCGAVSVDERGMGDSDFDGDILVTSLAGAVLVEASTATQLCARWPCQQEEASAYADQDCKDDSPAAARGLLG